MFFLFFFFFFFFLLLLLFVLIVIFSDKVSMYEHNKGGKTFFEALSVYVRFITLRPSEVAMTLVTVVNHI